MERVVMNWTGCDLIEVVPGKMSGTPVFRGTRLPADTVVDHIDDYMDRGMTLDMAIRETLDSFPGVPRGAAGVRALLAFRDERERVLAR